MRRSCDSHRIILHSCHPESRAHGSSRCSASARGLSTNPTSRAASVQKLIDDMIDTMHDTTASGSPRRRCTKACACSSALLDDDPDAKSEAAVLINPEISPNDVAPKKAGKDA